MFSKAALALGLLTAAILLGAVPASATTFCVPGFHAGCRDNGTNFAIGNLEVAMEMEGSDGVPDRVSVGPITYAALDSVSPEGSDPLTVVGAGTNKTRITTSSSGNIYVVNLSNRPTRMSRLSIVVPASFPDAGGNGAALQTRGGTFDHVNIVTRNPGSAAVESAMRSNTFRDCRVYGMAGGYFSTAFQTNDSGGGGTLRVIHTTVLNSRTGIDANTELLRVLLSRSRIVKAESAAVEVSGGAQVQIENTVIAGNSPAARIYTSNAPVEGDASVAIRNSTITSTGDASTIPLRIAVDGPHSATMTVVDSIISGFNHTWSTDAPAGPGLGTADLTLLHSNFRPRGMPSFNPAVHFAGRGNINRNPRFAGRGNYHLKASSPSIDAGSRGPGVPRIDLDGRRRPLNGDGRGRAIRDQGAYEFPARRHRR